mgnify:CR=1 FL=1
MNKKQNMIDEVYSENVMKALLADMPEEEKAKIDVALNVFVEEVALPLVDAFEQIAKDQSLTDELKKQLAKQQHVVLKKL